MSHADSEQGPLEPNSRFLKYQVCELIGRGGHAWVYQGRDDFLGRDVAIKVLHQPGGVSQEMLRRGQAEAQLLSRLKHRNIVEVFDAGIARSGLLYIVMELLRGCTLRDALRVCKRLSVEEAVELFVQIADGVESAHAEGAIHRDLKPENVFIAQQNQAKVLDFGIAKFVDAASLTTRRDVVHGTLLYMSPEHLYGVGATRKSDIYALGTMMYEALLGQHPYLVGNDSPTIKELSWLVAAHEPPSLAEVQPSVPAALADLISRALHKRPEQRFDSMKQFSAALAEFRARHAAIDAPAVRELWQARSEPDRLQAQRTFAPVVVSAELTRTAALDELDVMDPFATGGAPTAMLSEAGPVPSSSGGWNWRRGGVLILVTGVLLGLSGSVTYFLRRTPVEPRLLPVASTPQKPVARPSVRRTLTVREEPVRSVVPSEPVPPSESVVPPAQTPSPSARVRWRRPVVAPSVSLKDAPARASGEVDRMQERLRWLESDAASEHPAARAAGSAERVVR